MLVQQAYMKSSMPYRGVKMPELRSICKRVFAEHPLASGDEWRDTVLELWRKVRPVIRNCSADENLWKRRVSIICQISFKKETDLELLYANIEANLADRDFFIRKAIGWALRAHAWTDPQEVARYVSRKEARLSGLSRREALKNIGAGKA